MFATLPGGTRDTTEWSKRKLDSIFAHASNNSVVIHISLGDVDGVNTLLDNEPYRKSMTVLEDSHVTPWMDPWLWHW